MTDREIMQQALEALTHADEAGFWELQAIVVTALRERLTIIKNYPEKDNLAQSEQEPVAYAVYHRMGGGKSLHWPEQHSPDGDANKYQLAPLYTAPPQREWQRLTDKEREEATGWSVEHIEAKLKEKNTLRGQDPMPLFDDWDKDWK